MARTTLRLSLLAISVGMALVAQAQAQSQSALIGQREAAIARLSAETGGNAQVSVHEATGAARFVRVAPGAKLAAQRSARVATDAARLHEARRGSDIAALNRAEMQMAILNAHFSYFWLASK